MPYSPPPRAGGDRAREGGSYRLLQVMKAREAFKQEGILGSLFFRHSESSAAHLECLSSMRRKELEFALCLHYVKLICVLKCHLVLLTKRMGRLT